MSSGFVAGTLVHTDRGLVPIQNLQVGDWVLSSPEQGDGSVRKYKPVVKMFKAEEQEIYELIYRYRYILGKDEFDMDMIKYVQENIYLLVTHPIYVSKSYDFPERTGSWQPANELLEGDKFILCDKRHSVGSATDLLTIQPLLKLDDNVAFGDGWDENPQSSIIKFNDKGYDAFGVKLEPMISFDDSLFEICGIYRHFQINTDLEIASKAENVYFGTPKFTHTVYNLEVEDNHTYFVGEQGLWVGDNTI